LIGSLFFTLIKFYDWGITQVATRSLN